MDVVEALLGPMHPGRRVAPIAKYRVHPIPGTQTNPTRDPCRCVGWVRATDDLLSEGGQSLNSIFADLVIGSSVSLLWEMMLWLSVSVSYIRYSKA